MTEENTALIGLILIFSIIGAFIGSFATGFLMEDSYIEDLCVNLYSNTQDYKACLDRPWKEIIEEMNK